MKYLYLKSKLHTDYALKEKSLELFNYLEKNTGYSFIDAPLEEVKNEEISLVYVATGGTAGLLKESLESLKEPVILLTSGSDNSLSASMEMLTYMTNKGKKARLLHGSKEELTAQVKEIVSAIETKNSLNGLRLGLIGKPSDWLISTEFDYNELKNKLGIEVIEIEMKELLDEISKKTYPDSEKCRELMSKDFDKDQIGEALHIYGAFTRLVDKYRLDGFSVRCFDLLTSVKNTGCLGLALLNSQGVFAGCEGDLPSLISMVILGKISGQPVFMSNPSRINNEKNEMIFAHCTLPLNMPEKYKLDTHYESNIGVAISGDIPAGSATIFKASGLLDRYFLSSSTIQESLHENDLCRSQIRLKLNSDIKNFYQTPVGNHYLICLGDYTGNLKEFFELIK